MRSIIIICFAVSSIFNVGSAQQLYFPPTNSGEWETVDPAALNFCPERLAALDSFLEVTDTRGFLLLDKGKIAIEYYYEGFQQDSAWYWASAGKTLTAFLFGIAQQEGQVHIDSTAADYLGAGWSSLDEEGEDAIRLWHHLTMTTGLDETASDNCLEPECFQYLTSPGTRWAYHNPPYTILSNILEAATGVNYNIYTFQKLTQSTGISGLWVRLGGNRIFFSTPRKMARFGLLNLNEGVWDGQVVLGDTSYLKAMKTPSQELNESYGYLWWLNGKESYMLPQSQIVFDGPVAPNAPEDAYWGLGLNSQIVGVIPSQDRVVVRMGNAPDSFPVPATYVDDLWGYIEDLECDMTSGESVLEGGLRLFPNPGSEFFRLESRDPILSIEVYDMSGQRVLELQPQKRHFTVDMSVYSSGTYHVKVITKEGRSIKKWVKQ